MAQLTVRRVRPRRRVPAQSRRPAALRTASMKRRAAGGPGSPGAGSCSPRVSEYRFPLRSARARSSFANQGLEARTACTGALSISLP
ncbi:hypothetical protein SVIOM74S_08921 [Streptomyces violarus]